MGTVWGFATMVAMVAMLMATHPAAGDRLALWHIVHDRCVPAFTATGDPAPCRSVHLDSGADRGAAVLKDLRGATQFLLIPTRRVTGIEDPALLAPDAPNYFAAAWSAIAVVSQAAKAELARDDLGLAINAAASRSQDQLHIHMDCVRTDVRAALHALAGRLGGAWTPLDEPLAGGSYRAMRIDGLALDGTDPFHLLAAGLPGGTGEMGRHTLVVVGMTFADDTPGFVLLDGQRDPPHGGSGHGEDLQDHDCAVARR